MEAAIWWSIQAYQVKKCTREECVWICVCVRVCMPEAEGRWNEEMLFKGSKPSVIKFINSGKIMSTMVTIINNTVLYYMFLLS